VTASDIACTILVYENTKEVWEEDLQIKASSRTDEKRHNAMHHKKKRSIVYKGESISKCLAIAGQTMDESVNKNCSGSSRNSSQVMYGIHFKITRHCNKRNTMYARGDNQFEELGESEEESEASDKDDWQIDMPDGDEIDDIEEASVYDDSPRPRNKQSLSC
jgi:hypothetical protein